MLTRSSQRISNPMRYTGYNYNYAHAFFGKNSEILNIKVMKREKRRTFQ